MFINYMYYAKIYITEKFKQLKNIVYNVIKPNSYYPFNQSVTKNQFKFQTNYDFEIQYFSLNYSKYFYALLFFLKLLRFNIVLESAMNEPYQNNKRVYRATPKRTRIISGVDSEGVVVEPHSVRVCYITVTQPEEGLGDL